MTSDLIHLILIITYLEPLRKANLVNYHEQENQGKLTSFAWFYYIVICVLSKK